MKGICTHLWDSKDPRKELEQIKAAGFDCIRQDLFWNVTNPKLGRYEFGQYDKIADACRELDISVLWVVCYGNNYLDGTETDKYPPRDLEAWRNWLVLINARFGDVAHGWEIWNEPNREEFWDKPDVEAYTKLCYMAEEFLEGQIYCGALSNLKGTEKLDWDWIKSIALFCAINDWKLSLHPYKVDTDEILKVQELLAPIGQDVEPEFAVTENGWSKAWGGSQPQMTAMLQKEAEVNGYEMWLYCWDNPKATDAVEKGFSVKPAVAAI